MDTSRQMIPTVESVRARAVRVPMTEPHRTASGVVAESPLVLVDVTTDAGVTGHAVLFTYTAAALRPVASLVTNLAPLVTGQPLAPVEINDRLTARFRLLGTQGLVGMAIAGIDMALWDAMARAQNLSLVRLLGGVEKPLRAYGAVGYDGPSDCARVAEAWVLRGFSAVKVKIGYPEVKADIEVIRAIRSAVGPDVSIMVDYNQCLPPAQAIERLRRLEDFDLAWVEEPTLAHDYAGHARIAREIATPIQCGENWWGPLDLRHAIDARASDLVMPEVMKIGGVTGWRRAAALAEVHGLPISSHLWPEISAHLLASTPVAHWLEYADWWNPVIAEPLQVTSGIVAPSPRPGSGVEWNERVVGECLA
jgi:mandelate racemase